MADNTELNPGTGGDVIATDDIAGIKHQQVKVEWGVDGTATPVSAANPMPVVQTGTLNVGTVTAVTAISNALPAGTNNIGDVDILSIAAGDNNIGNVDIVSLPALAAGTNNIGDVDVLSLPALPTGANTIGAVNIAAAQTLATVTTVGTVTTITNAVTTVGAAAEDAAASGNPVLTGGRYDSTPRTLETGDVGAVALNASGQVLVEIAAGAGSGGTAAADDADFVDGTTSGTPVMGVYESTPTTVTDGDLGIVGITETRALKVSIASGGIAGIVDDAAFTPATSEVLPVGFTFDDAAVDSVNEGDIGAGRMSANRCQYVNIRDAAGNERGLNIDASGNLGIAANSAVNVAQINGVTVLMGNGASGTGAQRVTLANDSTGVLATVTTVTTVTNITNQGQIADDAAFTPATTRVNMAGYFADETATDSVDEGDGGAARMTLDRKVITTPYPHTAGGLLIFRSIDLDETEEEIKATAGQVYGMWVTNTATTTRFVKFYNATAANVTVGSTTPVITIGIPGNATDDVSGNFGPGGMGIAFGTAITVAATTGVADADTGAPGANEIIVNVFYA